MELAIKDLSLMNSNKKLDNYHKTLIKNYNHLKKRLDHNHLLDDLVKDYYNDLLNYKKTKKKQIVALNNLIKHLKSLYNDKYFITNKIILKKEINSLKEKINDYKEIIEFINKNLKK